MNLSLAQVFTSKLGQVLLVLPVSRCPTILASGYKDFHFRKIFSNDKYCFFVNLLLPIRHTPKLISFLPLT